MSAVVVPEPDAALRDAFEAAVADHGAAVRRVCRAVLGDEHLGADAAQEVFARLWRRMLAGRAPERAGGWLRQVALTSALDLRRRREALGRTAVGGEEGAAPEPAAPDAPAEEAALGELERRLADALTALSEGQRTVFLLRHEGGLPLVEVAETLGVTLSTVKTQFARACLGLQARLAPFDPARADAREADHEHDRGLR